MAKASFGSTEYAHLLTVKAPPSYAFSATQVWSLPQHLQDRIVGQSPELQRERERRKRADTGEPRFIGFMVPRDFVDDPEGSSTAASDPSAGLTPKMADEVVLARGRLRHAAARGHGARPERGPEPDGTEPSRPSTTVSSGSSLSTLSMRRATCSASGSRRADHEPTDGVSSSMADGARQAEASGTMIWSPP